MVEDMDDPSVNFAIVIANLTIFFVVKGHVES